MKSKIHRDLKNSGRLETPVDEAYYDRLHDQIMLKIDSTEIQPVSPIRSFLSRSFYNFKQQRWPGLRTSLQLGVAASALVIFSLKSADLFQNLWSSSRTVQLVQNNRDILSTALDSPEDLSATFISFQNNEDFLMEVASHVVSQLPNNQLQEFVGQEPN
jgi:hypothetical protein